MTNEPKQRPNGYAVRFVAFGLLMAAANAIPYVFTQGSYRTDGLEIAGFPFRCYEFGGISPIIKFNSWAMAGNLVIAALVAAVGAYVFRNGFINTLRRWQTWGTPFAG